MIYANVSAGNSFLGMYMINYIKKNGNCSLTHYGSINFFWPRVSYTSFENLINMVSANGLLPGGTKPLPEVVIKVISLGKIIMMMTFLERFSAS